MLHVYVNEIIDKLTSIYFNFVPPFGVHKGS